MGSLTTHFRRPDHQAAGEQTPVSASRFAVVQGRSQAGCIFRTRHPGGQLKRCVVNPCSVTSSGRPAVLVENSAEPIVALDPPGRQREHLGRPTGSALPAPLVRPGVVVMVDELGKDLLRPPPGAGGPRISTGSSTQAELSPTTAPNRSSAVPGAACG